MSTMIKSNPKHRTLKGIVACLIVLMVLAGVSSSSLAQVWFGYKELSHPLVYKILESGDILIDDFESGSPKGNGWWGYYTNFEPPLSLWDSSKKAMSFR